MINVLLSGLHTTLQDIGRYGHRAKGIPVSGTMDSYSASMANTLVGNAPGATVLEFMAKGPVLQFEAAAIVVISGAYFSPKVNENVIKRDTPVALQKGDVLSFGNATRGVFGYLAIRGGFLSEEVLGSASQYKGVTEVAQIKKGMVLQFNPKAKLVIIDEISGLGHYHLENQDLEVYEGPEYQDLSEKFRMVLDHFLFEINPQSGRMAYILDHDKSMGMPGIITAPVQPGTVQLTPTGKLMVLMRDGQTTGGYSRVLQLTEDAINQLAQKRAGERVRFKRVDVPFGI